ncbi:hypothetical protein [Roseibium sp. Sym1]|uniref:hypothetical protein n=1 Tax=Roseibium sp. Sym1 TaxID=3016006 RepID=UPI0022B35E9C|nr:hypothetical protein [Roseibium sp. Sym1]
MTDCIKLPIIAAALFFNIFNSLNAASTAVISVPNVGVSYNNTYDNNRLRLVSGADIPESCVGFFQVKIPTLEDGLFEISQCLSALKANRINHERASETIHYIYRNTLVNHVNYNKSRKILSYIISDVCDAEMYGKKFSKEDVVDVISFVQGRGLWGDESKEVTRNSRVLSKIYLYSEECLSAFEVLGKE